MHRSRASGGKWTPGPAGDGARRAEETGTGGGETGAGEASQGARHSRAIRHSLTSRRGGP